MAFGFKGELQVVISWRSHKNTLGLSFPQGSVVDVLCSLIASVFSQTGWLAPSPRSVGGPMVMNVFSSL